MNSRDAHIAGMAFRCRADAALRFEYVDEGSKLVSGYNHAELVETGLITLPDLIQPADRDDARRMIQDGINRKGTFAIPFGVNTKDRTQTEGILVGKGVFSSPLNLIAIEGYILRIQHADELSQDSGRLLPENIWQRMLDHTRDIIAYIGPEGMIRYISPSVTGILRYRSNQICGKAFTTLLMPDEQNRFEDIRQRIDTIGGGSNRAQFIGMTADGTPVQILIHLFASGGTDGSVILTASPASEEKPTISPITDLYRAICEASPVPLIITRRDDQKIVTVNKAFLHLTGRTDIEEVTGMSLTATGLQNSTDDFSRIESVLDQNQIFEGKESKIQTLVGTTTILLSARSFAVAGEEAVTWSLVPIPIKTVERILPIPDTGIENIRTIFHEFKTDLQLLESILRMKGVKTKSEAKDVNRQDRSYLYAISSFYQMADEASGTDNVPVCAYLNTVKANIIEEYTDHLQLITISVYCEGDWNIRNTAGIPLGIIATELLVNCAIHAFSPGETGRIEFSFTREEDWFIMQVRDTGRGFPDELTHGQPSGAGLAMVKNLAMQLSGTASFSNDGGARARIIFPDPDSG